MTCKWFKRLEYSVSIDFSFWKYLRLVVNNEQRFFKGWEQAWSRDKQHPRLFWEKSPWSWRHFKAYYVNMTSSLKVINGVLPDLGRTLSGRSHVHRSSLRFAVSRARTEPWKCGEDWSSIIGWSCTSSPNKAITDHRPAPRHIRGNCKKPSSLSILIATIPSLSVCTEVVRLCFLLSHFHRETLALTTAQSRSRENLGIW